MSIPVPTSVNYLSPLVHHLPGGISSNRHRQAKRARSAPFLMRSCHTHLAPSDIAFLLPVLQRPHEVGEGGAPPLAGDLAVGHVIAPPLLECYGSLSKVMPLDILEYRYIVIQD